MTNTLPCLTATSAGEIVLDIIVAPRASSNRVVGLHDGRLKIAVTAPPVDGRANGCILEFVAKLLGVPKRAVALRNGETGRKKRLVIIGIPLEDARANLAAKLPKS